MVNNRYSTVRAFAEGYVKQAHFFVRSTKWDLGAVATLLARKVVREFVGDLTGEIPGESHSAAERKAGRAVEPRGPKGSAQGIRAARTQACEEACENVAGPSGAEARMAPRIQIHCGCGSRDVSFGAFQGDGRMEFGGGLGGDLSRV